MLGHAGLYEQVIVEGLVVTLMPSGRSCKYIQVV